MSLSLRGRLLWRLLPAIAIVWLISAALAAWQTHRQTVQALDANLAQSANIIHALLMHEIVEHATAEHRGSSTHDPSAASGPWLRQIRAHLGPATNLGPLAFQIDTLDGRIELRSPNGPDLGPRPASPGFADVHDRHQGWRVYTRIDSASGIAVRVAEPARHRLALLSAMLRKLLLPLIVSGPLLALLIWLSVGKGLQPLRRIDAVLRERAPTHLAPLGIASPPSDLAPLVRTLDGLFERLRITLERERRFTADAAHELRTPLAAIKAQAQVAGKAARETDREHAIEQLLAGVDRASRTIDQLLALARYDSDDVPSADGRPGAATDLQTLTQTLLTTLFDSALRKRITLSLDAAGPAWVALEPDALELALRNLIDNAIRYTPDGGLVEVAIESTPTRVRVMVADSGPGILEQDRERVFQRFHRGPGEGPPGSGLGLSIVARVMELAGARIQLGRAAVGGLEVCIDFPRAIRDDVALDPTVPVRAARGSPRAPRALIQGPDLH